MLQKIPILIILIFVSCTKDYSEIKINDFSKSHSTIVEPYKFFPYAMFNLEIKGFTDDTIRVRTKGTYNLDLKLIGNIDTLWYSDYYGEGSIECIFEPYRATSGEIIIKVKL